MQTAKQSTISPAVVGASFAFDHRRQLMEEALGIPLEVLDNVNETARVVFMRNASNTTSEALEQLMKAYNAGEFENVDHFILAVLITGVNIGRIQGLTRHSLMGMLEED